MAMNLTNILAKAQKMMIDENFNRQVERAARAQKGQGGDDAAAMEEALFGVSESTPVGYQKVAISEDDSYVPTVDYSGINIIQEVPAQQSQNSKIPAIIRESFTKTPSPVEDLAVPTVATSISQLMANAIPQQQQAKPQPKKQVTEQKLPQASGIDYNALKFIINECIKENLKSLNESQGSNGFRGMRIAPGNVIQFIDSAGNLYEGELKLKKKAKR